MKKILVHIVSFFLLVSVISEIIETSFSLFDFELEITLEGEIEEELEEELEEIESKVISLNSTKLFVRNRKIKKSIQINENLIAKDYLSGEIPISVPPPQIFKLS